MHRAEATASCAGGLLLSVPLSLGKHFGVVLLTGSWPGHDPARATDTLSPPSQRSEPWFWYRLLIEYGGVGEILICSLQGGQYSS